MVYLVEDDAGIRELALYALAQAGIEAEGMADDAQFRAACERRLPDAVMLDIMLPEVSGLEILARIRNTPELERIPVMMVTAKSSELDIVRALDAGADEYLCKPYGMMEMVSRVRALLRRATDWGVPAGTEGADQGQGRPEAAPADGDFITFGPLSISERKHRALLAGQELQLTAREFDLLLYLMKNPGIALSRDTLMQQVWGWGFSGGSRTVDMHILTLRQKLGDAAPMIETVRSVGYRFFYSAPTGA